MSRGRCLTIALAILATAACAKHPKNGECRLDADCANQAGYGKICVEGRCQECAIDTDCQAGFRCRANACVPRLECESPADCGEGKTCQDGRCVVSAPKPECQSNEDCGQGRTCESGRCVAAAPAPRPSRTLSECLSEAGVVHFTYDRANLSAEARQVLGRVSRCLATSPGSLTVEGNCDERGTAEYNVHLGQRRAEAVKKYLMSLPARPSSISATSNGRERPTCTEHNEACWSQNRRVDIKAQQ